MALSGGFGLDGVSHRRNGRLSTGPVSERTCRLTDEHPDTADRRQAPRSGGEEDGCLGRVIDEVGHDGTIAQPVDIEGDPTVVAHSDRGRLDHQIGGRPVLVGGDRSGGTGEGRCSGGPIGTTVVDGDPLSPGQGQ